MKTTLSREHRKILETTVAQVRVTTEALQALAVLQNRVFFGGAFSGRDINGVNKTISGLLKLIHNAVSLAEIAGEKGAKSLLLPVSCRRQLFDLSDDMATRLDVEFYQDAKDALLKALVD